MFKDPVGAIVNEEVDVGLEGFQVGKGSQKIGELGGVIPDLKTSTKGAPFFEIGFEIFAFFADRRAAVAFNGA